MIEIWKDIKGYEGIYELRNDGLLHSFPRNTTNGGYTYGSYDKEGYFVFDLSVNGKRKNKRINRLVYETFVGDIPKGYDIHHINGIKTDNRVENLCLLEKSMHSKMHIEEHKEKTLKSVIKKCSKPIIQYTLDGVFVAEYESIMEAERQTGIKNTNISSCCKNKRNKAGEYVWRYKRQN